MAVNVITRYLGIARGALVMTGNTFGLDKQKHSNTGSDPFNPGNYGSQGVFMTVSNTNVYPSNWASIYNSNQSPSPVGIINNNNTYDIGSSAKLYIPSSINRILHAELVWFANLYSGVDPDKSIYFTHPTDNAGPVKETIDESLFQVKEDVVQTGYWQLYVRSADVTSFIKKGENTYTVEGVSAYPMPGANDTNCSGWCILVAYEDLSMDYNNMSMYIMAVPVALVRGYERKEIVIPNITTPVSGVLKGKAVIAAAEGDVSWGGDYVTFGNTTSPTTRLSVGNHLENNFFVSEVSIADNDADIGASSVMGSVDTRGSMGNNNHDAANTILGCRQGIDIARVDISNTLTPGQTSAYMNFVSEGDAYIAVAFGAQIMVYPRVHQDVDKKSADVGDILTYTSTIENGGSAIDWLNVEFQNIVPAGTQFVPGTIEVYYNGVLQSGFETQNPMTGFVVKPVLTITDSVVVKLKIQVVDFVPIIDAVVKNVSQISYTLVDIGGESFRVTETSNPVETEIIHGQLVVRKMNYPSGKVTCTNLITYLIEIENIGNVDVTIPLGAFVDPCPNNAWAIGGVASYSTLPDYDESSIEFNSESTIITNVKQIIVHPSEIIIVYYIVTPYC